VDEAFELVFFGVFISAAVHADIDFMVDADKRKFSSARDRYHLQLVDVECCTIRILPVFISHATREIKGRFIGPSPLVMGLSKPDPVQPRSFMNILEVDPVPHHFKVLLVFNNGQFVFLVDFICFLVTVLYAHRVVPCFVVWFEPRGCSRPLDLRLYNTTDQANRY